MIEGSSVKSSNKKIMFACSGEFPGSSNGADTLIKTYARGFGNLGHRTVIFSTRVVRPGTAFYGKITELATFLYCRRQEQKRCNPLEKVLRAGEGVMKTISAFTQEYQKQPIDLVLLYQLPFTTGLLFFLLAKWYNIKTAYVYADWIDYSRHARRARKAPIGWILDLLGQIILPHLTTYTIALSVSLEKHVYRSFRVKRQKIITVRSIVDCDRFHPQISPCSEILALKKDKFCIVYLGSFWPHQGVETLIEAAEKLFSDETARQTLCFVIVGPYSSSNGERYKQRIEKINLKEHVITVDRIAFDRVPNALAAADALITPRDDSKESVSAGPMKIAEYLAMGKPVIASATGDIANIARDNVELLFCQPNSPQSIVDRVLQLYNDKTLQVNLSLHARALAENYFSNSVICEEIITKTAI